MTKVNVSVKNIVIPSYEPEPPDQNPMFFEKRVYQGSSGAVYPLPFCNKISEKKKDHKYIAVMLENDYLEIMILPEIGGRIHTAIDKTNGYDFIYRQDTIKPALVGLSGPWISGGIEFNWPQHHRPGTYMPDNYEIENHRDGSVTVWLSSHDPLQHMKGMHGVCLHPNKSIIELKVRAYNRTQYVQTFLWWANVATKVSEAYQSFFPPDVAMVADHAKRDVSSFPLCDGYYYGIDYRTRATKGIPEYEIPRRNLPSSCKQPGDCKDLFYPSNDLSWYANIPVPTSYMCVNSDYDFFGGYDHQEQSGIIHIANHHISPGKKQWTWGNHEFGYAWDRNLSEDEAPYIELMAGVYTDNQPDFSFLMPGETKTWTQFWYPFQGIGIPKRANTDFALNVELTKDYIRIGIAATERYDKVKLNIYESGTAIIAKIISISPSSPKVMNIPYVNYKKANDISVEIIAPNSSKLVWQSEESVSKYKPAKNVEIATEPPPPNEISSNDELFIIGLHLQQYRHATRSPEPYWLEALSHDPLDARCNNAMGIRCLQRGELNQAFQYFNNSLSRLTSRNPNPYDGEAFYNLGLVERLRGNIDNAYDAFYKSTWNMPWSSPAYYALAEIACLRKKWGIALEHLDTSLSYNAENLKARNLKTMILIEIGKTTEARVILAETHTIDPLDIWSRYLANKDSKANNQEKIDLAIDLQRVGFYEKALLVLKEIIPEKFDGINPIRLYLMAWISEKHGDYSKVADLRRQANRANKDYCFPCRLEEMFALEAALSKNSKDARAAYYLGNLFYSKQRHKDALLSWILATKYEPNNAIAWRNSAIAWFNIENNKDQAIDAFEHAILADPNDARLFYERDQLWKRVGIDSLKRLKVIQSQGDLVKERDDLCLETCALLNQQGYCEEAAELLYRRNFHPWEGGEGMALEQHRRIQILQGRKALENSIPTTARSCFERALTSPENLGEAWHLLQNLSDIYYWLGIACDACNDACAANKYWNLAASAKGDFQAMETRSFSEMTYYSAMAMYKLGRLKDANRLLNDLKAYAEDLMESPAKIDYFATSLPTLLLFDEDIEQRQQIYAQFLQAQASYGLGDINIALELCKKILIADPSHAAAFDLHNEIKMQIYCDKSIVP